MKLHNPSFPVKYTPKNKRLLINSNLIKSVKTEPSEPEIELRKSLPYENNSTAILTNMNSFRKAQTSHQNNTSKKNLTSLPDINLSNNNKNQPIKALKKYLSPQSEKFAKIDGKSYCTSARKPENDSCFSGIWHETLTERKKTLERESNSESQEKLIINEKVKEFDQDKDKSVQNYPPNLLNMIRKFKDFKKTYIGIQGLGKLLIEQQQNLENSLQIFTKELNEIEKVVTKETNIQKIKEYSDMVDTKIDDLKKQIEIMTEQIQKLKNWQPEELASTNSQNKNKSFNDMSISNLREFQMTPLITEPNEMNQELTMIQPIKFEDKPLPSITSTGMISPDIEENKDRPQSSIISKKMIRNEVDENIFNVFFMLFKQLFENIERRLIENFSAMDILKSEVDNPPYNEEVYMAKEKNIDETRNTMEAFSQDTRSKIKPLIKPFLSQAIEYLINLNQILSSNVLKFINVKNHLSKVLNQVVEIQNFRKQHNYQDLTDKLYRNKFENTIKIFKENLYQNTNSIKVLCYQVIESFAIDHQPFQYDQQELDNLEDTVKMIEKTLITLKILNKFEMDYDQKRYSAYLAIIQTSNMIEILNSQLKLDYKQSIDQLNSTWNEAEDLKKSLASHICRMNAILMNMAKIKEIRMLNDLIEKPYVICKKLIMRLEIKNKELIELMINAKNMVLNYYQNLIIKSTSFTQDLDFYIKKIIKDHEPYNSSPSHNNSIHEKHQEELLILEGMSNDLKDYVELFTIFKSVHFLKLIPTPAQRIEIFVKNNNYLYVIKKLIMIGTTISTKLVLIPFQNLESKKLSEQLSEVKHVVIKTIKEFENMKLIINSNDKEDYHILKGVLENILKKWINFDQILNRLFKFEQSLNIIYKEYEESDLLQIDFLNAKNTPGLDTNDNTKDKMKSIDKPKEIRHIARLLNSVKILYEDFIINNLDAFLIPDPSFNLVRACITSMRDKEIADLENIQLLIEKVVNNVIIFQNEFGHMMQLPYLINILNKWAQNLQALRINGNKICEFSNNIELLCQTSLRTGLDIKVQQYIKYQKKITSTTNIILELFDLGIWLNEAKLREYFGKNIGKDKNETENYLKDLEQKFYSIKGLVLDRKIVVDDSIIHVMFHEFEQLLIFLIKFLKEVYQFYKKINNNQQTSNKERLSSFTKSFLDSLISFKEYYVNSFEQFQKSPGKGTYLINVLQDFFDEVITNDLKALKNLWSLAEEFENCLYDIQDNFIKKEFFEKKSYRNLQDLDSFDLRKMKENCLVYSSRIKESLETEEISRWSILKESFSKKMTIFGDLAKVLETISIIQRQAPRYLKALDEVLQEKESRKVRILLGNFDKELMHIIDSISKSCDESKGLKISEDSSYNGQLDKIFKEDILAFYIENRKWCRSLSDSLAGISEFYQQLQRKFKNKIHFLREDWVQFFNDYISKFFNDFASQNDNIKQEYDPIRTQLITFTDELQTLYLNKMKTNFLMIVDCVQYINETFLTEWFFTGVDTLDKTGAKIFYDKMTPKLEKLQKKIMTKTINFEKLKHRITHLYTEFDRLNKCINLLQDKEVINELGFEEVIKLDTLLNYWHKNMMHKWLDILSILNHEFFNEETLKSFKKNFEECIDFIRFFEYKISDELTEIQVSFITNIWSLIIQNDEQQMKL